MTKLSGTRESGEESLGNSKYKGPVAGISLVCSLGGGRVSVGGRGSDGLDKVSLTGEVTFELRPE